MKHVESFIGQIVEKSHIEEHFGHIFFPELQDTALAKKVHDDLLSGDPFTAAEAIATIANPDISLSQAAYDLVHFMKMPYFNNGCYEQWLYRRLGPINPPDKRINYGLFFDTNKPFEESLHYLRLTSRGLSYLYQKAEMKKQSDIMRSFQQEAIKECLVTSSELVRDSVRRDVDPVEPEFIAQCSFGYIWSQFFHLFGKHEQVKLYKSMEHGIDTVLANGSALEQHVIESMRKRLPVS